MIVSTKLIIETRGNGDTKDVTELVEDQISPSGLSNGVITLFVCDRKHGPGLPPWRSNQGLLPIFRPLWREWRQGRPRTSIIIRWGEDNGHSHVRAALVGPSLSVPFVDGRLTLGAWQQIILVDFDTRARRREVVAQILGE